MDIFLDILLLLMHFLEVFDFGQNKFKEKLLFFFTFHYSILFAQILGQISKYSQNSSL